MSLLFAPFSAAWIVSTALWVIIFLATYIFYLPAYYKSLSFKIENGNLVKRGGVLYEKSLSAPLSGIQYVMITANPFDKIFAICSLVAVVPGGRVVISGLTPKKARALADTLTRGQGGG